MAVIYRKTAKGHQVLVDKSVPLSGRQRMLFILMDGRLPLADVLESTKGIGITSADIESLIRLGLIESDTPEPQSRNAQRPSSSRGLASVRPGDESRHAGETAESGRKSTPKPIPVSEHQSRYKLAYPIAVQISADLGIWGFKLNLAVEQAMGYDDLLTLLPRLQAARGRAECQELENALLH